MVKKRKQSRKNNKLGLGSQLAFTGLIAGAVGLGFYQSKADASREVFPVQRSIEEIAIDNLVKTPLNSLGKGIVNL